MGKSLGTASEPNNYYERNGRMIRSLRAIDCMVLIRPWSVWFQPVFRDALQMDDSGTEVLSEIPFH